MNLLTYPPPPLSTDKVPDTSLVNEYRATEEAIKELQERLKSPEQDDKPKKEPEFEEKLRTLMGAYQKSLRDVISLLDPDTKIGESTRTVKVPAGKRARKVEQYKNPHTGEVTETKSGNHKTLKEWKAKWGPEAVESWATLFG